MVLEITDKLPNSITKCEAYADDIAAGGTLENLLEWWKAICELGPLFGYYPEESKSWLVVKSNFKKQANIIFKDTQIKITCDGKKHLGAAVGSELFKEEYVTEKIKKLCAELRTLVDIAKTEPQAAYSSFVSGFRHKLTYMMRTIPNISHLLTMFDDIVQHEFIPAITGKKIKKDNKHERKKTSMVDWRSQSLLKFLILNSTTQKLYRKTCVPKSKINNVNTKKIQKFHQKKAQIAKSRKDRSEFLQNDLRNSMNSDQTRLLELSQETGASSWLTALPLLDEGYDLNKQCFQDLLRIRYGWSLKRFPVTCECGSIFNIDHALTCKKGGFISLRHNEVRNITAKLLSEVCHDVTIEPMLQPLTGENLSRQSNTSEEARLDISSRGFWVSGQMAFCDVRVYNPLAKRYGNMELMKCYTLNEKEKKKAYNNRINEVEHGTLTPLVFSATGGMSRECRKFYSRLSQMLSDKRGIELSKISVWIRRKISFALMRTLHMCVRGSRSLRYRRDQSDHIELDPEASELSARIQ